jgi:hypothetical protein
MSVLPRSLFRYRSLSAYSLGELVNQTMWYSKPTAFNDPFDCALTIDQRKFSESFEHAIRAGIAQGKIAKDLPKEKYAPTESDKAMFMAIRDRLKSTAAPLGLCCLSENSKSILMWAHYANNHRGFCVEYSSAEGTMLSEEVSKVIYTTKMPSLTMADLAPGTSTKTVETLWRTKAACWRYEREWRALAPEGNKSYPARSPILSVIFGAKMPQEDRALLGQAISSQPHIHLKEAFLDEDKFAIRIRKVQSS